jgi:TetR/AcrR family transcriptional regulator, regulator of autoinduction and epiphytic fitness
MARATRRTFRRVFPICRRPVAAGEPSPGIRDSWVVYLSLEISPIMSIHAAPEMPDAPRIDGRNLRAESTRRKIIHGARALVEEQGRLPKVADVARRSDVSVRSVFQHYQDVETLFIAVVDAIADDLESAQQEFDDNGSLEERVLRLTEQQSALYERLMPAVIAGRQLNPAPAALIERGEHRRAVLRDRLETIFRPELASLTSSARAETIDALQAVAGWDCWIALRQRQGMLPDRATTTMGRLILAVLWSATNNVGLMVT